MISHDRVRFTLDDSDANRAATSRAAQKAFGMSFPLAYEALRVQKTIICRPSQFARFLIYRSKEVSNNGFKQFNAELVPAPEHEMVLDVTRNAA
ncbi:hypothetical protein [Mesorhizobium sp. M7A.F.Ca.MR.362.00.0.0]|uniref:hypothetical protein n=1 Tax=Mesorhizobium sp. M7A.F.Ca.MR.362.00.0.0 TaxID=2496779 RepID=UPI000FD3613B|nr:hypothetical protein [Mesorhizobium sp. M7A.F.Ca.MR.362.00.0.0]RUU78228.1 hypothetical protein EOC06_20650 [Mesorhizobium sp. M7A.F.Ca.MR.362.00.0.0]RWN95418.1 MAG: hypothetical protein EOS05_11535 [Mesorhizobium sp.]